MGRGNLWGLTLLLCSVSFSALNQAESLTAHSPWQRHGYMNVGEYVLKGQKHYESSIYAYTFCLYICFCAYSAPMPLITFTRDVVPGYGLWGFQPVYRTPIPVFTPYFVNSILQNVIVAIKTFK